jgi:hypothetical protein
MPWIPIRYRDFYDIPRAFVVERAGALYLFDCLFDEHLDEYPDRYNVYRLDPELAPSLDTGSWQSLASKGKSVGEIPTERVQFDATRRAAVDDSVFDLL